MINILHSIDTSGPGGAEKIFVALAKGLEERRIYKNYVAISGKGWLCNELERSGFEPVLVDTRGSFNVKYLLDLIKISKKYGIDIIQSHLLGSNVYCSLVGMLLKRPVISTFHGFADAGNNDKLLKIKLYMINRGSKEIVFVSDHLKNHFRSLFNFNENKAITIYNGIELTKREYQEEGSLRKSLGLAENNLVVGSIGNVRKAKGYDYLLKAAALVLKSYPNCKFVVVGEGSGPIYEHLLSLRGKLGLNKSFYFLGLRNEIERILSSLDVFVLSSISEGFSLSTIEAMARGVPVICTKSGGPEEIISHGKNGLLVPPKNPEALAAAICELIGNKELANQLSCEALKIAKRFSLSSMLDKYETLYLMNLKTRSRRESHSLD